MESELHKLRIHKDHKAKRDHRPVWPYSVAALCVVIAGFVIWIWQSSAAVATVQTIRVHIPEMATTASSDTDLVTLSATGYIIAAHKIELATKVVGRVEWVGVEMGDKVQKGQVLVRLEDDEYRAVVTQQQGQLDNAKAKLAELVAGSRPQETAQVQALLDQAQAELTNAQINCKRLEDVEATHSVSRQQIDDAEALVRSRTAVVESQRQLLELSKAGPRQEEIDAQRATVHQLEGSFALSMVDLDNTIVRSPIAATILERNVEVGEFVTTGFVGDKGAKGYVVSIADLNDLRVELDISQNDFAKISPQQPCWITTDAYPDRKYPGVVDLISPEANRQKATVQVRVKVLNPDELLKPDMNATVAFLSVKKPATPSSGDNTAEIHPPIRVPSAAVHDGAVFVVEDGKAVRRTVSPGLTSATGEVEIRKGLIGGEDLIISPTDTLKDGDKVKISDSKS